MLYCLPEVIVVMITMSASSWLNAREGLFAAMLAGRPLRSSVNAIERPRSVPLAGTVNALHLPKAPDGDLTQSASSGWLCQ